MSLKCCWATEDPVDPFNHSHFLNKRSDDMHYYTETACGFKTKTLRDYSGNHVPGGYFKFRDEPNKPTCPTCLHVHKEGIMELVK
jgi:hypothetical protein